MSKFLHRAEWVDHRHDAAEGRRGVKGDGVLQNIGGADGENLALLEAAPRQSRRRPTNVAGQLSVSQNPAARAVDERRLFSESIRVPEDEPGEGNIWDGDIWMIAAKDHGAPL